MTEAVLSATAPVGDGVAQRSGWHRVEFAGRVLLTAALLVALFIVFELWGTNLITARAQSDLKAQFRRELRQASRQPAAQAAPNSPPTTIPSFGAVRKGQPVALIQIPSIGVDDAVVEGVNIEDLWKGPGHYPKTALPGEAGNAAIAGHRTTYGAPFNHLDELNPGDKIVVTTRSGRFLYRVRERKVVAPNTLSVLAHTTDARLTLTTCNPKFSAAQRLVVVADLAGNALPDAAPPATRTPRATASSAIVSHDDANRWGLRRFGLSSAATATLVSIVGGVWWWAYRRRRSLLRFAAGLPPFLVALFLFYVQLGRLLPANY